MWDVISDPRSASPANVSDMATTEKSPLLKGAPLQATQVRFVHGDRQHVTHDSVTMGFERRADGQLVINIELCRFDPELLDFIHNARGESLLRDRDGSLVGWSEPQAGWTSPQLHVDLWSACVEMGAVVGYFRWSCLSDDLGFAGTTFTGADVSMLRLSGAVHPGSFEFYVEPSLPDYPLGTQETV